MYTEAFVARDINLETRRVRVELFLMAALQLQTIQLFARGCLST